MSLTRKLTKNVKDGRKVLKTIGVDAYKKSLKNKDKFDILNRVSNSGKIFGVKFIKKDGSERVMSCRKGVTKHLRGGSNTVAHLPQYTTVFSCNDKGYRNINLNTIKEIKGCGEVYTF